MSFKTILLTVAAMAATVPVWSATPVSAGSASEGFWSNLAKGHHTSRPAKVTKRSAYSPTGTIYGVIPNYMGIEDYNQAFWGSINPADGVVSPIFRGHVYANDDDYQLQSGAVRDGILYIPQYRQDMVTHEIEIIWKRININTGEVLEPLSFGGNTNAYCYSLTYDDLNDRFIGLSMDVLSGAMGNLIMATPKGDTMEIVSLDNVGGREGDFMAGIAYCPADGMVYGVKDNGGFYMIDPDWAEVTLVKRFDENNEWFLIPEYPFATPLVYSPRDKAFVTVCCNYDAQRILLGFLDMEGQDAVEGFDLDPTAFVASLWCPDKYAVDEAPDTPGLSDIIFEGPSLTGTVAVTAPATTYAGDPIRGNIVMSLTLNGEEVYNSVLTAADQRVVPLELAEGFYTASLTAWLEDAPDAVSPAATAMFYVGHDTPEAPRGVKYASGVISWNAVPGVGVHNGYVDASAITYDVWMDGVRQNEEPLTVTSMTLTMPDSPRQVELTVTANADGKTSEPSPALSSVLGQGYNLPVSFAPTAEEAELFTVFNANADDYAFKYTVEEGEGCFRVRTGYYYETPDDWLFFPPVAVGTESLYSLALTYVNTYRSAGIYDNIDIWIGKDPTVEGMTSKIYSHSARETPEPARIEALFAVPEPGNYVLGIHATAGHSGQYRGVDLSKFTISEVEGSSVKAPGDAVVRLEAGEKGALEATVFITAPTTDITGAPLAADDMIEFAVTCGSHNATASALPGEETQTKVAMAVNGFNEVTVTPNNAHGAGIPRISRVFAGIDKPVAPVNLQARTSDDNMEYTLTWEAPATGVNGGYTDPDNLTYHVYIQGSAGNNTTLGTTRDKTYTYTYTGTAQSHPTIGVTAINAYSETSDPAYVTDYLGKPFEVPLNEEFNGARFSYAGLWWNDTSYICEWSSVSDLSGLGGFGNISFKDNGGLMCSLLGGGAGGRGKLLAPKFSTRNVPAADIEIVYWDYAGAGDMELWVRSASNQEERLLARLSPDRLTSSWQVWSVNLPEELLEQDWVQINLVGVLGANQTVIMDAYRVVQNIEFDFKVAELTAPYNVFIGEMAAFSTKVINSGNEPMWADLVLDLLADGNVVDTRTVTVGRMAAGNTFERNFNFEMKTEYAGSKMEVRASIVSEDDQVASNNVATESFLLTDCIMPVVNDLTVTEGAGGNADLAWSRPATSYGDFESFESMPSFVIKDNIADWLNVDVDGLPQFPIEAIRWADDDQPSAWTVFDAEEKGTLSDERLCPHSGTKMLMARAIMYQEGVETPIQNSDWLISPEVVGGTTVDFWMNTISSQYSETIAIYYSTTSRDPGSFVKGRNFTKSGSETWEHQRWTLPADAKYFAFVYESWGTFAAMLDDITFTPAEKQQWDIVSYDIWYEDDARLRLLQTDVTGEGVSLSNAKAGTYYVTVNADRGEGIFASPLSNGAVWGGSGVASVGNATGVIGSGRGYIFVGAYAGEHIEVYSIDGRLVASVASAADREVIDLPAGIYTVRAGHDAAKVLVK